MKLSVTATLIQSLLLLVTPFVTDSTRKNYAYRNWKFAKTSTVQTQHLVLQVASIRYCEILPT